MSKGLLIALSTQNGSSGEALLWIIDTRFDKVAVDLGKTKKIGSLVGFSGPNVLCLTHDDNDHIGGWDGFKDSGLQQLQELWVPYEWGVLVHVLATLDTDLPDDLSVEAAERAIKESGRVVEAGALDDGDQLGGFLEEALKSARKFSDNPELQKRLGVLLQAIWRESFNEDDWRGKPEDVAKRAVKRAVRITDIISSAIYRRVRVRYFSVDHIDGVQKPWELFSKSQIVTIANALEVRLTVTSQTRQSPIAHFAQLLTTTIQNRRALCPVLWHPCRNDPAAFVWSDSTGDWTSQFCPSDVQELFCQVDIVTAPHHGSDSSAHDKAWIAMKNFYSNLCTGKMMILAGGQHNQGVRQEYLHIPDRQRGCTRCRIGTCGRMGPQWVVARVSTRGRGMILSGCCYV